MCDSGVTLRPLSRWLPETTVQLGGRVPEASGIETSPATFFNWQVGRPVWQDRTAWKSHPTTYQSNGH